LEVAFFAPMTKLDFMNYGKNCQAPCFLFGISPICGYKTAA